MSTNFYFVKPAVIPIKEIFERTPIKKHITKAGDTFFFFEGNFVMPAIKHDSDEDLVVGVTRYAGNSAIGVLKCLVKEFDLYFISEYEEYEGCDSSFEFLESFRRPIVDEIRVEELVSELILICKNGDDLIEYINQQYKNQRNGTGTKS